MNSDGNYAYLMGSLLKQKVLSFLPHRDGIFCSAKDDLVQFFSSLCLIKVSEQFILILKFKNYSFFYFYMYTCVLEKVSLMSLCFKYIYCSETTNSPHGQPERRILIAMYYIFKKRNTHINMFSVFLLKFLLDNLLIKMWHPTCFQGLLPVTITSFSSCSWQVTDSKESCIQS